MVKYNSDLQPVHHQYHQYKHQDKQQQKIINVSTDDYVNSRSNITMNENKLFHRYKQFTSIQTKYNLIFPIVVEKFIKRLNNVITVMLCLQLRPSRHYTNEIKTISANLIDRNVNLLRSSSTKRSLDAYKVQVIDSKSSNAGAWIGGGITIDDSLIDKIITVYARGTVTSTLVTINDTRHQISLKDVNYQDVLACILGHEMTHVAARHIAIDITIYSVLSLLLYNLFKIDPDKYQFALKPLMLLFSRLHEHDADCYGLLLAYNAGYNPLG
jgi:hypothetical protein